jgi:hypothetical protein
MSHFSTWEAIKKQDGAKRYVAKYACKPYQKVVPIWFGDIGRFWGCSKGVRENRETPRVIALTEDELRQILRDAGHGVAEWDVPPKHIWGVGDSEFAGLP